MDIIEQIYGSQLAKMDVESAFRIIILVHPEYWLLLGINWKGLLLYIDQTLLFGLTIGQLQKYLTQLLTPKSGL